MVRKRVYRRRGKRPKSLAPTDGWLLKELARLSGLPRTTMRYYMEQKILRPIERRGTATRYPRRALLLVLGITRLKAEGKTSLAEKKRKLDSMGDSELLEWLRVRGAVPVAAARALGIETAPAVTVSATPVPEVVDVGGAAVEHWQCVELMPGLSLVIRADAKEPARLAARQIVQTYALPTTGSRS